MRHSAYSFLLVGLLGNAAFQVPQAPANLKPLQKDKSAVSRQVLALLSKEAEASKAQYLKTNEELRQAWLKQSPEAQANLEKAGIKLDELQKQAHDAVAPLSRFQGVGALSKPTASAADAWTQATRLSDQLGSRLTATNPAWQAKTNEALRKMVADQVWFQPEATPAPTPLTVNSSSSVTHYSFVGNSTDDPRNQIFEQLHSYAQYNQAGTEYSSDFRYRVIEVPASAKTVRVVLRDASSQCYMRNLALTGYASAENKFTMSLMAGYGVQDATVSQSMQHSVFLIGGYMQETKNTPPTVELTWTRPSGNTDQMLVLELKVESWAGGGPLGSVGIADYMFRLNSFDVITSQ